MWRIAAAARQPARRIVRDRGPRLPCDAELHRTLSLEGGGMQTNDAPDTSQPPTRDRPIDAPPVPADEGRPDVEPDMDAIRDALNERERRANADRFRSMGW